ncbi:FtsX-like permease family protein [Actinoplanes awajinensis]|uniref:Permease n=1 Tax=Actinoplanes awajinensis subsp. mycoplanecinus TaxID=135947 RepID=A0A101JKT9_9ACTN|nr:FtsX-like permease family protein [Actinoplanes awajinensis]KUL28592.1 permease [Actinoplanes awajinensis subsp. mycoplanecinus]
MNLHWPSVRGRARADAGPLTLSAVVVAVVTVLAGSVPVLLRSTADEAVRQAVSVAGDDADVKVEARWEYDDGSSGGRVRSPRSTEALDELRDRSLDQLGSLRDSLLPPIEFTDSPYLKLLNNTEPRSFRLNYLAGATGPAVTWLSGGAPKPAAEQPDVEAPWNGPPWPVQVGVSEKTATRLGLQAGDRLAIEDDQRNPKDVRVSGVFRATDPADPAWQVAPWLLDPAPGMDGAGNTRYGGLLSAESLPDARLAFGLDEISKTVRFRPDPAVLTLDSAEQLAATVVALKASSGSSASRGYASQWATQLDAVLHEVRDEIDAAQAQASVLLAAVSVVAVLILLLAADLLVARRSAALAVARQRGASLIALGAELLLESVLVTAGAAALGVLVAALVAGGVAWGWLLPVCLAAVLAGPAFGLVVAYRATRDRRVPANRSARKWAGRTAALRRLTGEATVLAAAVTAVTVLHQRGVLPSAGGTVLLPAAAPALGVLTGALVLLRVLPALTGLRLRQALRSTRPLAVFGAARAAYVAARALPVLALVSAAGLATFALTVSTTVDRGLTDGAWRTVGADARLDLSPRKASATDEVMRKLVGAAGVRHVVAAQVIDVAPLVVGDASRPARLVVVDSAAYRTLLADTPLTALPPLPAGSGAVPALVRSGDGKVGVGSQLKLPRDGAPPVSFDAVGVAPAIGGGEDVVLVDAAAMTAAGVTVVPNTIWVTGPGAAQAAKAAAGDALVEIRTDVERARRDAPLVTGLIRLAWASAGTLLALGLLGFALGAAAGAPERWQTLSRLRTLGLRTREARRVATAELLPLALLAAAGGPLLGAGLAWLTLGPLALRLLTGQPDDPALILPWAGLALIVLAFPVMVTLVVPAEAATRRRRRLSEVLRVGGA